MENLSSTSQSAAADSKDRAIRTEKRPKQREQLKIAFADPLDKFTISPDPDIRHISQELADEGERLKARIRKVSASSQEIITSFSPEAAEKFVTEREPLTEDLATHLKACRSKVREARQGNQLDRKTTKRVLSGIEELDAALLKERAALANNRAKLEFGILSHRTHARIGEAYLAALVENLPEPAGARIKKQRARDSYDQDQFKTLVRQAYTPDVGSPQHDAPDLPFDLAWCPVTRAWHPLANTRVAHIVPYGIGEFNAAYIFGVPVEEGWRTIWDYRNGLILHEKIERSLDAAQLVIVPDGGSIEGLRLVVLDESILNDIVYSGAKTVSPKKFRDLNNSTLQFKTEARPLKRYLYFLCLMSLYRRHRFFVEGSERDREKIQMGKIWGTPGKWMRGSIIRALALEVGDILNAEEGMEQDTDAESMSASVSPEKERKIAVEVREAIEGMELEVDEEPDDEY